MLQRPVGDTFNSVYACADEAIVEEGRQKGIRLGPQVGFHQRTQALALTLSQKH